MKKLHHSADLVALEKIAEAKAFKCSPMTHSFYGEGTTINFAPHNPSGQPFKLPEKTPCRFNVVVARDTAHD